MTYYVLSRYFHKGTLDVEINPCIKRDVHDLKKKGQPPYDMGDHLLYVDVFQTYQEAMSFALGKFEKPVSQSGNKVSRVHGLPIKKEVRR